MLQKCHVILPLTASSTKDVPELNEYPFVLDTRICKPYEGFKMYITGEMWQTLKQLFEKKESYAT